jgi:predicted DNA-binding transcriptional regulator AlpA
MNARKRSRVTRSSKECLDLGTRPQPTPRRTRKPAAPLEGRIGLTQDEAARAIGKSASCLRRWARLGLGPRFIRCGGRALVFPLADLNSWLTRNAQDPADVAGK